MQQEGELGSQVRTKNVAYLYTEQKMYPPSSHQPLRHTLPTVRPGGIPDGGKQEILHPGYWPEVMKMHI